MLLSLVLSPSAEAISPPEGCFSSAGYSPLGMAVSMESMAGPGLYVKRRQASRRFIKQYLMIYSFDVRVSVF